MLCVGKTPPPVRLGRNLILSETPCNQSTASAPYDSSLGSHVGVSRTGGNFHLLERLEDGRRITGLRTTKSVNPTDVDPRGMVRSEFLLVGGSVDLQQGYRDRQGRQRFNHRERSRQPRLVTHAEVPVSILSEGDLAPGANGIDPVSDPSGTDPIGTRSCAMQRDVDGDGGTNRIESADRVATIHDSVADQRYPEHQVLSCRVAKSIEVGSGQDHPVEGRGKGSRFNHLERPKGGVGQRSSRDAHQVQQPVSRHVEEVYQEMTSRADSARSAQSQGSPVEDPSEPRSSGPAPLPRARFRSPVTAALVDSNPVPAASGRWLNRIASDAENGPGAPMDHDKAKELLRAERLRTEGLLSELSDSGGADRIAANQSGDMYDSAEPLTAQQADDSVQAELLDRLAAIDRAESRLESGTYGYSVRSGQPIPDDRLEADPTADLTIEEANQVN